MPRSSTIFNVLLFILTTLIALSIKMSAPKVSTNDWLAAAKHRRTVYGLKGTSAVPDSRVQEILEQVLSFAPSSYNTQPVRLTLITGDKHKQFWDLIITEAKPIFEGAGIWEKLGPILESHKAAYGSVRSQRQLQPRTPHLSPWLVVLAPASGVIPSPSREITLLTSFTTGRFLGGHGRHRGGPEDPCRFRPHVPPVG